MTADSKLRELCQQDVIHQVIMKCLVDGLDPMRFVEENQAEINSRVDSAYSTMKAELNK